MYGSQRKAKSMAIYGITASSEGNDWAAAELSGTAMLYYEEQREASKRKKLQQVRRKEMEANGGAKKKTVKKKTTKKRQSLAKEGVKGKRETKGKKEATKKSTKAKERTSVPKNSPQKARNSRTMRDTGVLDLNADSGTDEDECIDLESSSSHPRLPKEKKVKQKQQSKEKITAVKRKRTASTSESAVAKKKKKSHAASFRPILTNTYVDIEKPKETEIHECCCMFIEGVPEAACGSNCMNRMVHLECHPAHCPCGEECQNQRFQRRSYASVKVLETEQKGMGLEAVEFIEDGQFVIEYVGEVVSHDTCMDRLDACEKNFYVISLDNGIYIDASKKGNVARFMNHSCNPNCRTEKWYVRGHWRVGIFALRDIEAGSELTFDYQFQRVGKEKQECYCGAANCRGYLGEKKKAPIPAKKKEKVVKKPRAAKTQVNNVGLSDVLDAMITPPKDPIPHRRIMQSHKLLLARNIRAVRQT